MIPAAQSHVWHYFGKFQGNEDCRGTREQGRGHEEGLGPPGVSLRPLTVTAVRLLCDERRTTPPRDNPHTSPAWKSPGLKKLDFKVYLFFAHFNVHRGIDGFFILPFFPLPLPPSRSDWLTLLLCKRSLFTAPWKINSIRNNLEGCLLFTAAVLIKNDHPLSEIRS